MKGLIGTKKYLVFVALAWVFAFLSEEWPRMFVGAPLKGLSWSDAIHIWNAPGWPVLIILWYTIIFSIAYFLFAEKPIRYAVGYGVVVGLLAETFIFKMMTFPGFFLFIIVYGLMFYFPFMIWKKIFGGTLK
jgi:hypothetical protein